MCCIQYSKMKSSFKLVGFLSVRARGYIQHFLLSWLVHWTNNVIRVTRLLITCFIILALSDCFFCFQDCFLILFSNDESHRSTWVAWKHLVAVTHLDVKMQHISRLPSNLNVVWSTLKEESNSGEADRLFIPSMTTPQKSNKCIEIFAFRKTK